MTKSKKHKKGGVGAPPEAAAVTPTAGSAATPSTAPHPPTGSTIPVAHALPMVASAAAEERAGGVEPAVVGVARAHQAPEDGEGVDESERRMQETMERLLGGLEEYDEERNKLSAALHESALRVRDTHTRLKAALAPLTFAFGEEDGQIMFETVLDDPGRFENDKRPAIQQVAVAALAHDDAMHRAGDAQHRLEDYENKALPPGLFRRVVNQRFKHLEDRMRNLEQLLFSEAEAEAEAQAEANADATDVDKREPGATAVLSKLLEPVVDDCVPKGVPSDAAQPPPAAAAAAAEEIVAVSTSATAPTLVQHWSCEVRYGVRANGHDETFGNFVVVVSPVFPDVLIDADPEFNAIHQRRANRAKVGGFVRFLQHVMGERKMAMAMAVGVFREDEEDVLRLLWGDREWTWLDEIAHNELQLVSSEETERLSEAFHVVLVGEPVPQWGESRIKPARNQGFECLVRVLEELSQGGYYIRLNEIRGAAQGGGNTKHVQIFR